MTRLERENLIERYLRGEMSLEEEENFFIEVAANPELRYELKAYQVVERAIAGDRAAGDRPYTALRARMQKQLAATSPVAAQPSPSTSSSVTSSTRKYWSAALIAGALIIVALIFFTRSSHQEAVVENTPSQPEVALRDTTIIATPPISNQPEPATTQQSAPPHVVSAPMPKSEAAPSTITHSTPVQDSKRSASVTTPPSRQKPVAKRQTVTSKESTQAASNTSRPEESVDTSTADAADSVSIRFELMTPRSSQ